MSLKTQRCKTKTFVGFFWVFCLHVHLSVPLVCWVPRELGAIVKYCVGTGIQPASPGRTAILITVISPDFFLREISVLSLRLTIFLWDIDGQSLLVFIL